MAWMGRSVEQALDRWVEQGLLTPETAETLRAEAHDAKTAFTRRLGQIVLAALGAFALIAAAVLFAGLNWARLSEAVRTVLLVVSGGAVYAGGVVLAGRRSTRYAGYLLQTGGLGVVLAGLIYSTNAWPDGSAGAVGVGIAAFAVPVALLRVSLGQGAIMTGVHTAVSFVYLAVALDRSLGLDGDQIVWILDGVLLLLLGVLWWTARRWPPLARSRGLVALGVSFWAGLLLAFFTGIGPLDLSDEALYGVDLWALLMLGVTLWGIHGAPREFHREAYEANLAAMVAVLGFLAMVTAGAVWDLEAGGVALAGLAVGLPALAYGLRWRSPQVLIVGGVVSLMGTWIFALDSAGALGGAVALLISAVVLFWIATRVREEGDEAAPGGDPAPTDTRDAGPAPEPPHPGDTGAASG